MPILSFFAVLIKVFNPFWAAEAFSHSAAWRYCLSASPIDLANAEFSSCLIMRLQCQRSELFLKVLFLHQTFQYAAPSSLPCKCLDIIDCFTNAYVVATALSGFVYWYTIGLQGT